MNKPTLLFACLLLFAGRFFAQSPTLGNPDDLPFILEIEDVTQDELPGLHSTAFGQWDGWWVFIGGRIGGLHGFFPFTAFPENEANASIWLIQPGTGNALNFGVDALNIPFIDALKATNPQYAQDGEYLYICGGYGKSAGSGEFITFPVLTAVHLPQLVTAMIGHQNPSAAFRQIESETMRVCGGEMDKMGEYFYLAGGHDFSGNYTQMPSPMFTQVYTYDIRKFRINNTGTALSISDYSVHHDEQNLRRRDFTLAPLIRPDGSPALCLYGGVFRPDVDLPYYNPVYISDNQIFQLDATYAQVFSQYTCPAAPMYDSVDGSMYTLFFGGLSVHYFDAGSQSVQYDERVPFIRDISTFQRRADGVSREYLMPQRFDELLGANMIFAFSESAPHYSNEVLQLHRMEGKTLIGWLFGGIKAEIPNITPSSASKRMFQVFITPKQSSGLAETAQGESLRISPNPFFTGQKVAILASSEVRRLLLFNAAGVWMGDFGPEVSMLEKRLESVPSGAYFLQVFDAQGSSWQKWLKL